MFHTWPKRRSTPWFNRGVVAVFLFAMCFVASAIDPIILTTRSKQFTVRGRPLIANAKTSQADLVHVDPALLSLVCERVREALEHELGWVDRWRDPVFINVYQSLGRKLRPNIDVIHSGQKGWRYRIEMPDEVNRRDFIQPLIEVLLLEYANRGAREESVDVPLWLVEGMTEHLLSGALSGITLHVNSMSAGQANQLMPLTPYSYTSRVRTNENGMSGIRAKAQARGALTIDQLTWPEFDEQDRAALGAYRASSHLFVRELLRLHGGAECLCASLTLLPESLNWQTAFLRAFEPHFKKMIDVEKWWSLVLVQAKGRETSIQWSAMESQNRLEDVLYTAMQVRLTPEELPFTTPVSLQTLATEWAFAEQEPILRNKVNQLSLLRPRVPQYFAQLAEEYRIAIENYLTVRSPKKMRDRNPASRQVKSAVAKFTDTIDALDQRRAQLAASILKTASTAGVAPLTPP